MDNNFASIYFLKVVDGHD